MNKSSGPGTGDREKINFFDAEGANRIIAEAAPSKNKKTPALRFGSIFAILTLIICLASANGCGAKSDAPDRGARSFKSYREIPGVDEDDVEKIEALKEKYGGFTYGMMLSTELYSEEDGSLNGYSAHVCEWLTELFGITFSPQIVTWEQITDGLANGYIDFSGTLTPTDERLALYEMTDAIAQRTVKVFSLGEASPKALREGKSAPKYAMLRGAAYTDNVLRNLEYNFEPVYVSEYEEAYGLMKSGEVDALLAESSAEAIFDVSGDVAASDYLPMLYAPVSFTSLQGELAAVVGVVQKLIHSGGDKVFNEMYDEGQKEYQKHKFTQLLTDDEVAYIKNNPTIPFVADCGNYPVSFFDERDGGGWQGISFEVLGEISRLSDLTFEVANGPSEDLDALLAMLERGEARFISELAKTPANESRFLWPKHTFNNEWTVLISSTAYPNVSANRVYANRTGLFMGGAHSDFFSRRFPNHKSAVYGSGSDAVEALAAGQIDLIVSSSNFFLYLSNYLELPDYKVNIFFDNEFETTFGFNKDDRELLSIIDKALAIIDTKTISEQWRHRTYDYRLMLAQAEMDAQRPWLLGTSALAICVFVLLILLFLWKYNENRRLEIQIKRRTAESEVQLQKLDMMVGAADIGMWDMEVTQESPASTDNIFTFSNEFRRLLGYSDETDFPNLYESWRNRLHHDDVGVAAQFARHLLDSADRSPLYAEFRLMKKNGEYAYFRSASKTIVGENGKTVRAV
ncbi:MAG: transporter substrate-binding domain-containing protein, partial [Defluviitaleaceae bacterium]|nr:transporter substrate-binding domain-containing protein [Defluviitaleaceae bacterium]